MINKCNLFIFVCRGRKLLIAAAGSAKLTPEREAKLILTNYLKEHNLPPAEDWTLSEIAGKVADCVFTLS